MKPLNKFQSLEKQMNKSSNPWKYVRHGREKAQEAQGGILFMHFLRVFAATSCLAVFSEAADEPQKTSGPLKRVGSVEIDAATRTVVATGFVQTASDVLDYLAVGLNGKRYESVLTLELNAMDLQTALLLCGAKAGEPMNARDEGPPHGTPLNIRVGWTTNGVEKIVAAEDLIWNHRDNKPVKADWIFTGSVIVNGRFGASDEECFVAVRWDPYAIANIGSDLGKSYEDVYANTNTVPATNTPVTVYFQVRN